jgi:hypothetical protein
MMFEHVFARADQRNTPCFLCTRDPKNVQFYQKLGFEVVEEVCGNISYLERARERESRERERRDRDRDRERETKEDRKER